MPRKEYSYLRYLLTKSVANGCNLVQSYLKPSHREGIAPDRDDNRVSRADCGYHGYAERWGTIDDYGVVTARGERLADSFDSFLLRTD